MNLARWRRVRRQAFERDGWRCVLCGRAGALEADHVQRLTDGGDPYDLANVQTLCRSCHFAKSRAERGGPIGPKARAWRELLDGP